MLSFVFYLAVGFASWALLQGCGATSDSSKDPCAEQADCGGPGEGLCLDGECLRFDESTGYCKAIMALSFGRDMYQSAASCNIYFFHYRSPDNDTISCEKLLASDMLKHPEELNQLTAEPKYLVFNWSYGGTYFPDNLVQFIRPSQSAVVLVEAFSQLNAQGVKTAEGCVEGINFRGEQTSEFTVQLTPP